MRTETFFQSFVEGIDEIIKSDDACLQVIRWANKMSREESPEPKPATVIAFLSIGLNSETKRMLRKLKSRKQYIHFSSSFEPAVSVDERMYLEERELIGSFENAIPQLLLETVRHITNSEAIYSSTIEKYQNITYDGQQFIPETMKKMQRYLEATLLFLKSLDEANVSPEEKKKYTSQLLGMRKSGEKEPSVPVKGDKDPHSMDSYLLDMLKLSGMIVFDNHIPKLTERGIEAVRKRYETNVRNLFKQHSSTSEQEIQELFSNDLWQVNKDDAMNFLQGEGLLEQDGETLTDKGLEYFFEWTRNAFLNRSPDQQNI